MHLVKKTMKSSELGLSAMYRILLKSG